MNSHCDNFLKFLTATFCLSYVVSIIIPLQIYIGNDSLFTITKDGVVLSLLLCFVVLMTTLILVLWYFYKRFKSVVIALILALAFCVYLESGVLSIGLPTLDGNQWAGNLVRDVIDLLAWGVVIAIFLFFRKSVLHGVYYISLGILVLSTASLMDSRKRSCGGCPSRFSNGIYARHDILKKIKYSNNKNILMFILDSTPASMASEVMKDSPELRDRFRGFTAFSNNIGMHEATVRGIPSLMTGIYYGESDNESEFPNKIYGKESFLNDYLDDGYAIYFLPMVSEYGFTNCDVKREDVKREGNGEMKVKTLFSICSKSIPCALFRDIVRIKIAPLIWKRRIVSSVLKQARTEKAVSTETEEYAYEFLREADANQKKDVFIFCHTRGIHLPVSRDRDGNLVKGNAENVSGLREYCYYKLRLLGDLFACLRGKGIYDTASIVVCADHGNLLMRKGENEGRESCLLWYKPSGSQGDLSLSDAPTTHANLHLLLSALAKRNVPADEAEQMLSSPKRIFRAAFSGQSLSTLGFKMKYTDWIYDEHFNLLEKRVRK